MNPVSYETIIARLHVLELQLGLKVNGQQDYSSADALIPRISRVRTKIDSVYAENPELQHMPEVMKRFSRPGNKTLQLINHSVEISENSKELENKSGATAGPMAERVDNTIKQELILIKHPLIIAFYDHLKELSTMSIPVVTAENYQELDLNKIVRRKQKLEAVAREFDLLIAGHLLVLERYLQLMKSQSNYWKAIEARLRSASCAVTRAAQEFEEQHKYEINE